MAYRSDVYIKVHKDDEKELVNLLDKNGLNADKEDQDPKDMDHVRYVVSDVKWYTEYPEVKAVNSFVAEDSKYPRGLIAIGEDNATEEYGSPYEVEMYAYANIEW